MEFSEATELEQCFRRWYVWTVDPPGTYYLQVVQRLFKENQIAEGRFVALGRQLRILNGFQRVLIFEIGRLFFKIGGQRFA